MKSYWTQIALNLSPKLSTFTFAINNTETYFTKNLCHNHFQMIS